MKRCFGLLKYRPLTYQTRGSGKRKIRGLFRVKMKIFLKIVCRQFIETFPRYFFHFLELHDDITRFSIENAVSIAEPSHSA